MRFIIIFVMHLNSTLSKKILAWYDNSKRNLPWRVGKKSPKKLYYRLLSEFMLQQTQVKTVVPYFFKFTKKFKTIDALSKSNEKEILNNIEIHFVENANEIIKKAFISKITPVKNGEKKNLKIPEKSISQKESPLTH